MSYFWGENSNFKIHKHGFYPPKIMGGTDNFFLFYLGGIDSNLVDFGGTFSDGGINKYDGGTTHYHW